MRAIVCGDPHLSPGAWVDRPEIDGDAYRAFAQVVDIAIGMQLPLFLLGDVFEKRRPDPRSVECFCRQMDRMQEAGLPVLVIQGQHELDRVTPWLLVHGHPTHMNRRSQQLGDSVVYGLDWLPRIELQQALDEISPDTSVLLCHEVWSDVMGVGKTDGAFVDVPYAGWVLTGDYHDTYIKEAVGKTGQRMKVLSTGSTHMRNIAEPPQKCVFLLDTAMTDPTPIYLRTRPYFEFTISAAAELDQLCTFMRSGLTISEHCDQQLLPLVRIIFYEDVPDVYSRLTEAASGNCHLFWKRIPRQMEMEIAVRELPPSTTESLAAAVRVVSLNPRVQERCARLLASPDPDAETKEQYAQYERDTCQTPQTTA
jgi:hypothetical protein